jgi:D-alanine-D-alanine ligase
MKIALLYQQEVKTIAEKYRYDCEGRGGIKHILHLKEVLSGLGYDVEMLNLEIDNIENLAKKDLDLVFNLCDDGIRYNPLLEPHVSAILDILQIPYTGASFWSLATCLNKANTKKILMFHKIPTPRFRVAANSGNGFKCNLEFPLIVKPLHEDASIGIRSESVVYGRSALKKRVDKILNDYQQPALVEEYIDGREVNVGILGYDDDLIALPISEIVFRKHKKSPRVVSYDAKWNQQSADYKSTPPICPANLPDKLAQELVWLAKKAYINLECRDYGRVDFRIDKNGRPYVLEVNPNPDISSDAGLARMANALDWEYKDLVAQIVKSAVKRREKFYQRVKAQ